MVPGYCADVLGSPAVGAGLGGSGCSVSASGAYDNIVCGTGPGSSGILRSFAAPAAGVAQRVPTGGNCLTGVTAFTLTG